MGLCRTIDRMVVVAERKRMGDKVGKKCVVGRSMASLHVMQAGPARKLGDLRGPADGF